MDKNATYQLLAKQVESLIEGENNPVGQLANAVAILHETMGWWWTGFYMVKDDSLQLDVFQGPVACYNIKKGRGVCGTAWQEDRTIVVPDVEQFPGHIAASRAARLWCRCMTRAARSSACSTSTAGSWQHLTMLTPAGWRKSCTLSNAA